MSLENEIRAVVKEMPIEDQQIINSAFAAISHVCALADKLSGTDKLHGATAVAMMGARYQDAEDAVQNRDL